MKSFVSMRNCVFLLFVCSVMPFFAQETKSASFSALEIIAPAVGNSAEFSAVKTGRTEIETLKPSAVPDISFTFNESYEYTQSAAQEFSVPISVRISAALPQKNARKHVQEADSIIQRSYSASSVKAAADTAYQLIIAFINLEKNTKKSERLAKGAKRADSYEVSSRGSRTDLSALHLRQAQLHEKLETALYEREQSRVLYEKFDVPRDLDISGVELFLDELYRSGAGDAAQYLPFADKASAAERAALSEKISRASYESRFLPRISASAEYDVLSEQGLVLNGNVSLTFNMNTTAQKNKMEYLAARAQQTASEKELAKLTAVRQYDALIEYEKSLVNRVEYARKAFNAARELAVIADEKNELGALSAEDKNAALDTADAYEQKLDDVLFELLRIKLDAVYINGVLGQAVLQQIEKAGLL